MNTDRFKFRVWDNDNKRYAEDWDDDSFIINHHGTLLDHYYDCVSGKDEFLFPYDYGTDRYLLEQCTGLKDKNGKLIYEGDIVVQRNEYPYYDYAVPNYIGIVEWCEESAQFVIVLECVNPNKNGTSNGCCRYFDDDKNLEIIGNIHKERKNEP